MADILKAEGITGQIEVSEGVISITRKGLRATLSQGKKGELTIPVNHITKVDYKKASFLTNGHIHFLLEGEKEGSHGILNCPMTVIFNRKQEGKFLEIAELVGKLKGEAVKDSSYEGPPMREAVESAKTLHSDLLKDYDEETKKRIAQIISDGINSKRGLSGISVDIRKEFPAIDTALADNLAHTETSIALSQASLQRMKAMGVTGKEWITGGDDKVCEICAKNSAVGAIPVDQPFPSGHITTPAHDGCRCAMAPVMLPKKETPKKGKQ